MVMYIHCYFRHNYGSDNILCAQITLILLVLQQQLQIPLIFLFSFFKSRCRRWKWRCGWKWLGRQNRRKREAIFFQWGHWNKDKMSPYYKGWENICNEDISSVRVMQQRQEFASTVHDNTAPDKTKIRTKIFEGKSGKRKRKRRKTKITTFWGHP